MQSKTPAMKKIRTTFLILSITIFSSCIISGRSDDMDYSRNDVLGKWEITKSALKQVKKDEDEHNIISAFVLKPDSTVEVTWGVSKPYKKTGTWKWQPEKRIGSEKIGFNFETDVFVESGHQLLGFMIKEKDEEMHLNAYKYEFKKVY